MTLRANARLAAVVLLTTLPAAASALPPPPPIDLAIRSVAASPNPVRSGEPVILRVVVANQSEFVPLGVLKNRGLSEFTVLSAGGVGWNCNGRFAEETMCSFQFAAHQVSPELIIEAIAPNVADRVFEVAFKAGGGEISYFIDPNPSNNTATASITVVPNSIQSDLAISVFDEPDPLPRGAVLTEKITVTNLGPAPATDLVLIVHPSEVFPVLEVAGEGWSCGTYGQRYVCTRSELPARQAVELTLRLRGQTAPMDFELNAEIRSGNATDPVIASNTEVSRTRVGVPGD